MPAMMMTNAPVGPATSTRLPPNSDTRNPATMAVYSPRSGGTWDAMANASASGTAITPTVSPAITSCNRPALPYPSRRQTSDLGIQASNAVLRGRVEAGGTGTGVGTAGGAMDMGVVKAQRI